MARCAPGRLRPGQRRRAVSGCNETSVARLDDAQL